MLEHYHIQCLDLMEDYETEWAEDFLYFAKCFLSDIDQTEESPEKSDDCSVGSVNWEIPHNDEEFPDEDPLTDDMPGWAKKLYKKIVMITHPDRINNEDRRKSLERIFLRASEAARTGNYEDLVALALDLDLTSGLDDISLRPVLKAQVNKIKKKIQKIETQIPWVWGENFGDHSMRCRILRPMLAKQKIFLTDDEVIVAIKERENELVTG